MNNITPKYFYYSYFDTHRCRQLYVGSPSILGQPETTGNLLQCHLQFFHAVMGPGEKGWPWQRPNPRQGGLKHLQLLHDGPVGDLHLLEVNGSPLGFLAPASQCLLTTVKVKKTLTKSSKTTFLI
jgi:hypothetical protein